MVKRTAWLGIFGFGTLAVLAAAFWRERTLFSDVAFQTFLMLKDGGLQIQVGRWVAAATHVWPWLAVQMGLPLKGILVSFSMGYVLWPGLAFALCLAWGQWRTALGLLLFSVFMVKETFFWVPSELPQGMVALFLLVAWVSRWEFGSRKDAKTQSFENQRFASLRLCVTLWWLPVLLLPTLVWAHPLLVFPTVFACLFFARNSPLQKQRWLICLAIFAAFWVLKNKILPLNWYDADAQERAAGIWQRLPELFKLQSNRDFLHWCWADYWLFLPTLAAVLAFYFWKKDWAKFGLTASFSIAYPLFVNLCYPNGDKQFYLESQYLPLGFFVGVPLIWDVLPFYAKPKLAFGILTTVLVLSLLRIGFAHERWTQRLNWLDDFLKKTATLPPDASGQAARKLVVAERDAPMPLLGFSWGTPFEALLLSSLENADSARCLLVSPDPERLRAKFSERRVLLTDDKFFPFEKFPARYFNPQDTSEYVIWPKTN